jgi:hypothetical protein
MVVVEIKCQIENTSQYLIIPFLDTTHENFEETVEDEVYQHLKGFISRIFCCFR